MTYVAAHINQLHAADGSKWPPSFGIDFNGKNCAYAAAAMAEDYATRGKSKPTPPQLRTQANDRKGGSYRRQIAALLRARGLTVAIPENADMGDVVRRLQSGRWGVWMATDYDQIPDAKSCAPNFDGDHAVWLGQVPLANGKLLYDDPLCDKTKQIDRAVLEAAARKVADAFGSQGLLVLWVKQAPEPKPPTPPSPDPNEAAIARLSAAVADLTTQVEDRDLTLTDWAKYRDGVRAFPAPGEV